jgi:hypothetical protein
MFDTNSDCTICQHPCDIYGDHSVGCGGNGDRISRHNNICDVLFSACQSAALSPRKEVPALVSGSSSRPADIFLPCWKGGKPAALDATVISPLQQLTLKEAAISQGSALHVAEDRKRSAHFGACRANGITFIPLAAETLGGWGKEAVEVISSVGHLQGLRHGTDPKEAIKYLYQKLSIALWRGNATMWLTRSP